MQLGREGRSGFQASSRGRGRGRKWMPDGGDQHDEDRNGNGSGEEGSSRSLCAAAKHIRLEIRVICASDRRL
jgi:hypothetical protein